MFWLLKIIFNVYWHACLQSGVKDKLQCLVIPYPTSCMAVVADHEAWLACVELLLATFPLLGGMVCCGRSHAAGVGRCCLCTSALVAPVAAIHIFGTVASMVREACSIHSCCHLESSLRVTVGSCAGRRRHSNPLPCPSRVPTPTEWTHRSAGTLNTSGPVQIWVRKKRGLACI